MVIRGKGRSAPHEMARGQEQGEWGGGKKGGSEPEPDIGRREKREYRNDQSVRGPERLYHLGGGTKSVRVEGKKKGRSSQTREKRQFGKEERTRLAVESLGEGGDQVPERAKENDRDTHASEVETNSQFEERPKRSQINIRSE